jgi:hypothetical protein
MNKSTHSEQFLSPTINLSIPFELQFQWLTLLQPAHDKHAFKEEDIFLNWKHMLLKNNIWRWMEIIEKWTQMDCMLAGAFRKRTKSWASRAYASSSKPLTPTINMKFILRFSHVIWIEVKLGTCLITIIILKSQ